MEGRYTASVRTRKKAQNSILAMVAGVGLNSVGVLLAARLLGADGRGQMVIFCLVPTAASVFLGGGLAYANTYRVAREPGCSGKAFGNSLVWSITLPVILGLVLFSLPLPIDLVPTYHLTSYHFSLALSLSCFLIGYHQLSGILQGLGKFSIYRNSRIIQGVSLVTLTALAPLLLSLSPWRLFLLWSASYAISFLFCCVALIRLVRPSVSLSHLSSSFSYAARAMWSQLWDFLNARTDQMILPAISSTRVLGLYSVAVAISELLLHIPNALAMVVLPYIAASQNDEQRWHKLNHLAGRVAAGSLGGAVLIVAGCAIVLPLLIGEQFSRTWLAVAIISVPAVMLGSGRLYGAAQMGAGRPGVVGIAAGVSVVVTIGLDLILVPAGGVVGAASACGLGYVSGAVVLFGSAARLGRLEPKEIGRAMLVRKKPVANDEARR